ncbi:MAG: bacillithiol biosynthesis deacetylase BshB1 [Actinobacteria bacterium]|nr:bacillithiol biosynthesis deacetylase BshB1 [Actinomycetota bacterium]
MSLPEVDVLVVGAHPDDAEFGMGGTLCKMQAQGYKIGLIDLTRGELGSKGTPERRRQEAETAARVFGALFRDNLDLGDGIVVDDVMTARRIATLIRECKPKLVFTHHGADRHPDHRGCHGLINRAVFQSSLKMLELGVPFHCPDRLIFFPSNEWLEPDFVIDVTDVWEQKMQALEAFRSQFVEPAALIDQKYFGVADYRCIVESRCRLYGQKIGVTFGEGFVTLDGIEIRDPVRAFRRG